MSSALRHPISYTQNFLKDPRLVATLLDQSSIARVDVVYEIGPGKGIITEQIARRCQRVIAIEKDSRLAARLRSSSASPMSPSTPLTSLIIPCHSSPTKSLPTSPSTSPPPSSPNSPPALIPQRTLTLPCKRKPPMSSSASPANHCAASCSNPGSPPKPSITSTAPTSCQSHRSMSLCCACANVAHPSSATNKKTLPRFPYRRILRQ